MAAQPLNTTIQIFRQVRAQREPERHDSVKNLTGHLRRLILMAPGQEIRTAVISRDTAVTDFSAFMGQAKPLAGGVDVFGAVGGRGLPVVIGTRAVKDFSVVNQLTGIDFPVEIGADKFVQSDSAHVASADDYAAARATTGGTTNRL